MKSQEVSKFESEERFSSKNLQCLHCGTKISYKLRRNKFCNHSCAAKFSNVGRKRHLNKQCKICSTPITSEKTFCSKTCKDSPQLSFENIKTDFCRRKYLLIERGHKCEICLLSTWQGSSIPIELDHADGNSDNNAKENLRLLCPNCHAQTPTYRNKNKGKADARGKLRTLKAQAKKTIKITQ